MPNWADLFTNRQLVALTTFSDLVGEARERIRLDAVATGLPGRWRPPARRRHRGYCVCRSCGCVFGVCPKQTGGLGQQPLSVGTKSPVSAKPIRPAGYPDDLGFWGGKSACQ